eukprot:m.189789 g.189789  ORF g.189789 m.189789 type:complete len:50 (+) comp39423_c1_seq5:1402-1551(+)
MIANCLNCAHVISFIGIMSAILKETMEGNRKRKHTFITLDTKLKQLGKA